MAAFKREMEAKARLIVWLCDHFSRLPLREPRAIPDTSADTLARAFRPLDRDGVREIWRWCQEYTIKQRETDPDAYYAKYPHAPRGDEEGHRR